MFGKNLQIVSERLDKARLSSPLAASAVFLVAASKNQGPERLKEALNAGISHFGENRVQEAESKWPGLLKSHPGLHLHLIGPLQTNKVREAVSLFHVIETLDRPALADALAKEIRKQGRSPELFVQVNTGEEPQKAGVVPEKADAFIYYCKGLALPIVGLMCVPPADQPSAPHFSLLREIAQRHGLTHLSMGMSNDFETAIRMGATQVRIGTALFGERKSEGL